MTDVVTITLNPAVDLSTTVEKIVPVYKLRGRSQQRDPGGGGINVARVVKRLGGRVRAVYPVGGATGDMLRRLLDKEGVPSCTFSIAEETREDFFVVEISTGQPFRFILPGPTLTEAEWQQFLAFLSRIEPFPRFVVASGSLPGGVPDDFYARLTRIAKLRGARMVVDASGSALAAAVVEGVDLIKPNLQEMRELAGCEPHDAKEWQAAAKALVHDGKVTTVALTMGHLGAVLVTRDQVLRAEPLAITPISAVGAGDSFLGALLWQFASGAGLEDSFRYAVAAGAAALINRGTGLCMPEDVKRLARQVVIEAA
ncbi:6-phosphofructokinase 2 [Bradyrhizobium japonicum]|jgi:6-phosphofructokinase 2|uniref:Phosphofructokinase n=1 Tax=Bradyrhizobium elkanii TaxID=29448 RepID=A0ABV4F7A0_BRAEL|nr:1-phosphofructokinase family hexose kinase [Bradyrhizobium elkanii]MBP2433646.1 6-phosphofructokinase 2 [Bradyrhizobium elkanii]MCP1732968.1 6-phosphofructokinase 2 [Bradyrhizobium elkanii]MCP1750547.1 6-phosphofructokinase 2 [Bradyrhizobium elkanii]MCP1972700.1 6-phosphofructokinase 2 [Bradyrhizobium elkanii]MCP1976321.1 6-phosphofructokinase 2 [Bradyrhizobium elkanii]